MKAKHKKLDTSGHFPDFWHKASSQRQNKKIRIRKERRILNKNGETFMGMTNDINFEEMATEDVIVKGYQKKEDHDCGIDCDFNCDVCPEKTTEKVNN